MTIAPAAAWWTALDHDHVRCDLCPLRCRLRPGRDAPCGTRANRGGAMVPLEYGRVAAVGLDPVEKKPLYHFRPGSAVFSVAAQGAVTLDATDQLSAASQVGISLDAAPGIKLNNTALEVK